MKRLATILGYGDNRKDNLMLFSMQLVVVTLPLVEHWNSWAIIFMTLVWIFTVSFSNLSYTFKERKLGIFFILYFVWLCVGLLYTENISLGFQDIILKLSFLLFPFVLLFNKRIDQHFLRGVVRVFYYTIFTSSIYILLMAWYNMSLLESSDISLSLSFFTYEKLASSIHIQPIYLSMYMVFSFFAVRF